MSLGLHIFKRVIKTIHFQYSSQFLSKSSSEKGSTKMRSTTHDPYDPYNPYDPLTAGSFPKAEGLFRTTFRTISHSWMLGMSVICFCLQFILQFVQGQKEVIFAKTAQAYFSCAQDV